MAGKPPSHKSQSSDKRSPSKKVGKTKSPAKTRRESAGRASGCHYRLRSDDLREKERIEQTISSSLLDNESISNEPSPQSSDDSSPESDEAESQISLSSISSLPETSETLPSDHPCERSTDTSNVNETQECDVQSVQTESSRAREEDESTEMLERAETSDSNDNDILEELSLGAEIESPNANPPDTAHALPPESTLRISQRQVHEKLCTSIYKRLTDPKKLSRVLRQTYVVDDKKSDCCKVGSADNVKQRLAQINKGDPRTTRRNSDGQQPKPCECVDLDEDGVYSTGPIPYGNAIETIAHNALALKQYPKPNINGCTRRHARKKECFRMTQDQGIKTVEWIVELFDYAFNVRWLEHGDVLLNEMAKAIKATPHGGCDYNNIDEMNKFWSSRVQEVKRIEEAKYIEKRKADIAYHGRRTNRPSLEQEVANANAMFMIFKTESLWEWYCVLILISTFRKLIIFLPFVLKGMICLVFGFYEIVIALHTTREEN